MRSLLTQPIWQSQTWLWFCFKLPPSTRVCQTAWIKLICQWRRLKLKGSGLFMFFQHLHKFEFLFRRFSIKMAIIHDFNFRVFASISFKREFELLCNYNYFCAQFANHFSYLNISAPLLSERLMRESPQTKGHFFCVSWRWMEMWAYNNIVIKILFKRVVRYCSTLLHSMPLPSI